jgi:hypothetical protein
MSYFVLLLLLTMCQQGRDLGSRHHLLLAVDNGEKDVLKVWSGSRVCCYAILHTSEEP